MYTFGSVGYIQGFGRMFGVFQSKSQLTGKKKSLIFTALHLSMELYLSKLYENSVYQRKPSYVILHKNSFIHVLHFMNCHTTHQIDENIFQGLLHFQLTLLQFITLFLSPFNTFPLRLFFPWQPFLDLDMPDILITPLEQDYRHPVLGFP